MKKYLYFGLFILLSFLCCHKTVYRDDHLIEIKKFDWQLESEFNRLNIKFYLKDVPIENFVSTVVRLTIDGVTIENRFPDPTVVLDLDTDSTRKGERCVREEWTPAVQISNKSIQNIRLFIQKE
ncbi:hypothetical protein JXB12_12765 [candidate division KSB1 bacterium]|nr:hypothetical protein [candidate division KSB1 bacterium]